MTPEPTIPGLPDFEGMLRKALTPIEPPQELSARLEETLTNLSELAAEELDALELSAMRDPRNWMRPVVAAAVSSAAGAGLVVLRVRRQQKRRLEASTSALDFAERTLRAAAHEARRALEP
jgi:hypothetical protein